MQNYILEKLREGPQSRNSLHRALYVKSSGFDAWSALSDELEAALKTLVAERKITHAYNELYDCGPGNGMAVEWFYKINESA